jgi:long-chain fatty acid transport protein
MVPSRPVFIGREEPVMTPAFRVSVFIIGMLAVASESVAQRDHEVPIQFDFINPGARSLSLGGAFIGLADDATSAWTNPAGLPQLTRPEISIEGRGWLFKTAFVSGGRLSGPVTGTPIDTVDGPTYGESEENVGGLAFLSFVYPRGQFRVAGYRQEASRLRATAQTEGVFFVDTNAQGVLTNFREYPSMLERQIDVVNYGGSVAYRFGIVSVGADVHLADFNFDSDLEGFELPPGFFGPATYATLRYENIQVGDDTGVGFGLGVMVAPSRLFQAGFSYRRGAEFDYEGDLDYPLFPDIDGPYEGTFKVPDNVGGGVAVRPLNELTIAADVNWVKYSQLTDFIQSQVRFFPEEAQLYEIDDAFEFHLGGEYAFTNISWLPAVRVGFWREMEHAVTYSGEDVISLATNDLAEDVNHFSVGAGVAPTRRFELNAGFDFSDRANTMSFSAIIRF